MGIQQTSSPTNPCQSSAVKERKRCKEVKKHGYFKIFKMGVLDTDMAPIQPDTPNKYRLTYSATLASRFSMDIAGGYLVKIIYKKKGFGSKLIG